MRALAAAVVTLFAGTGSPALAGEIFGGALVHDVDTPITKSGIETGLGVQLGWRGDRVEVLRFLGRPSPYVFGSVNTEGNTNFAAAGLSWKMGREVYVRPGIGLAIHDGPDEFVPGSDQIYFGSRILFEPEVAVGVELSPSASIEASWVHLSHGQIFADENPGMDSFGIRLNWKLR